MSPARTLLMSDLVDSTRLNEQLGDVAMAALWRRHDALARALMRDWHALEVGRSDGFLLLFDDPDAALGFALAYHQALDGLPPLAARVGIHHGPVGVRENPAEARARGATALDVDGIALPVTARVMATAGGRQTLLTADAVQRLRRCAVRVESHGHWRVKGLAEPLELFEAGDERAAFAVPPEAAKAYRVVRTGSNWATVRARVNNLPAERDLFVGRLDTLRSIAIAFDDAARLVTVLGTGGVGKTRLALAYARGWLGDYEGGAWFCDLDAARGTDGIAHAVAQALEVPIGEEDPVRQLGSAIAARGPCLVVLDTFEHVATQAEATVGAWLELAPQARFLATSREVLGIAGEHSVLLAPLGDEEAAQLFRHRSRAAGAPAEFGPADEAAIAPLMDLLDRLPLAIELAAARARLMPPQAMLQRMGERFKVLSRRGDKRDRQATLRASMDWSWDLLSSAERSTLAQLSVFEGGISLAAAEGVVALEGEMADWIPDLLQALIEKSLLRPTGPQRFDLLRAVHDYAAERLAAGGDARATEARHWRHFAAIDETTAVAGRGADVDNIVFACRRAASSDPDAAVALLRNAWAVLQLTGPFGVALALGRLLEGAIAADDPRRAVVDRVVAAAAALSGDVAEARRRCANALALATAAGDGATLVRTQCLLAQLEVEAGHMGAAGALLVEAEARAATLGDARLHCACLNGLGRLHAQQSRWAAARAFYLRALALADGLGDRRWQGGLHGNLAAVARADGHGEAARTHWQTALLHADEVGDRSWAGHTHCNLGLLLLELGDPAGATRELHHAVAIARGIGHPRLEATALCNLGVLEDAREDHEAARAFQSRAAEVARGAGDVRIEGQARGYLGVALALLGRHGEAEAELAHAHTLVQALEEPAVEALVLLQLSFLAAQRGDIEVARDHLEAAQQLASGVLEGRDPEFLAMVNRVDAAIPG